MAETNAEAGLSRYVALLRGINVGGKNSLPMKDLVILFEKTGCLEVQTYIQSGNVVFQATGECVSGLSAAIESSIEQQFGLAVPVILRTEKEWFRVARKNPFLERGDGSEYLSVMFLADTPTPEAVRSLDPDRSPPDSFIVLGREIYLQMPQGARSKLSNAYFDSKLKTVSTARNWRTVLQIADILSGQPKAQGRRRYFS